MSETVDGGAGGEGRKGEGEEEEDDEKKAERKREKRERSTGYRRFNLRAMGPVTIWDSGDTGEVIDYHGTDLSPPLFSCPTSSSSCRPPSPHPPHRARGRRQDLYLAAATEMHPRLNGGRAFNGAANCETKNIWFPKEQP